LVEEKGFGVNNGVVHAAARTGKLDMLRWLVDHQGSTLQPLVAAAACDGQLHVMEWLLDQGCVLTEDTLYSAAEFSTTPTVAWLLDRGCPHDEETLVVASCNNVDTDDVLKFLIEEKRMRHDVDDCISAGRDSPEIDEAVLQRAFGAPLSDDYLERWVEWGDLERVRYALEHGPPLTASALATMIDRDECAMLAEALGRSVERGKLTDDVVALLDDGVRGASCVSGAMVQVLAQFGHHVRRGRRRR
jgi:hypothetical protein